MESRVLISAVFVIACFIAESYAFVASDECKIGDGWIAMSTADTAEDSEENPEMAIINLKPDEIALGKPFSFNLKVCAEQMVKPDRITVDATMPAHKHGMNYTPTVAFDEESNSYKVEDFLFHMPGEWEISLSTFQGEAATHYTKVVRVN